MVKYEYFPGSGSIALKKVHGNYIAKCNSLGVKGLIPNKFITQFLTEFKAHHGQKLEKKG